MTNVQKITAPRPKLPQMGDFEDLRLPQLAPTPYKGWGIGAWGGASNLQISARLPNLQFFTR